MAEAWRMATTMERFEFDGHDGSRLAARLDLPDRTPRATALFAHCFTCSKDIEAARRIARRLTARGLAVMRFDFTGLGHSEGEFANTGFTSNVEDLRLAARALGERIAPPQLLIGHSLGGAAVLAAAGGIASVKAVATIGAPADPAHVLGHLGASLAAIRRDGEGTAMLGGREIRIGRGFVEEVEAAHLKDCIAGLKRALLVLHAPRDSIVGIDNASAIFLAAKHPRSFVTLDDADHLLTRPEDAEYAAEVIAAWAARYLDLAPVALPDAPPEGVIRVSEGGEGYLQDILIGPHHLIADEPADHGGSNLGPSPYQFLAAGLGACTTMTIRMYARRKGLKLTRASVDVTHRKIHAADCADCETRDGKVDVFHRVIRLEGELTEAERARLMEIADRCPVHRTMEHEIRVETEAAPSRG
jgi:putative redox protein